MFSISERRELIKFLKVVPEWSAWFKNFYPLGKDHLSENWFRNFSRVLEYFETLEFYLENSNIYNRSLLTQILLDFYLIVRSACYRLALDIHI